MDDSAALPAAPRAPNPVAGVGVEIRLPLGRDGAIRLSLRARQGLRVGPVALARRAEREILGLFSQEP